MPSVPNPATDPAPDHLVRTHHRRRRHTPLVWSLALAVFATSLSLAPRLGWLPASVVLDIGHWTLVISSALALTTWLTRTRHIEHAAVARDLDREWALQARIETASELAHNTSALAAAQRAEASSRLAGRRPPRAFAWHSGLVVLAAAALLFLAETTVFGLRILTPASLPPALPEDISASIDWRTPESEIKATAIEEIALTASADTRTGFRAVTLEVSVNGEPRLSLPLDAAALEALSKPGAHTLTLPLYLDETGATEFDIVAYHLRADRIPPQVSGLKSQDSSALPPVTSPLQFIQIRPAREDVQRLSGGPGGAGECSSLLGALKAAQLGLLKQNFLLAHAPIAKTAPAWTEANATVSSGQKALSAKADEIRAFAIAESLPTLIVDNLTQVMPLMDEAAALIAATDNEPAARPQGRALALITDLEKLIQKVIVEGASGSPPKNADPFKKDDQRFKLPPRKDTPAGQLEQLAQDQSAAASDAAGSASAPKPSSSDVGRELARAPKPSGVAGSASDPSPKPSAADQAALAQRAADLAKNQQLSPAAQQAAEQAARDAAAAAEQLKQGDSAAARAPALAAAETLRSAADAQESTGRASARAQLELARRDLNQAAAQPDSAARADALAGVATQLRADARLQQESGSAEAARQLAAAATEAAKASAAERTGAARDPSAAAPADQAAHAAARAQAALSDSAEAAARAARQLQRGTGNSPSGSDGSPPGSDVGRELARAPSSASSDVAGSASAPSASPSASSDVAGSASDRSAPPGASASPARATDLVLGAQLAHALLNTPESAQLTGAVVAGARAAGQHASTVVTPELRAAADHLRVLLAAALNDDRRDEVVRRFNPEDLDPAYREAIETYFERLSREATTSR